MGHIVAAKPGEPCGPIIARNACPAVIIGLLFNSSAILADIANELVVGMPNGKNNAT